MPVWQGANDEGHLACVTEEQRRQPEHPGRRSLCESLLQSTSGLREGQMSHASLAALVTAIAIGFLAPVSTSGQSETQRDADRAPTWTPPRTPDGRPDFQGYWTAQTFTPLERPEHLAGKEFFTDEEATALQHQLTAEGVDPSAREILEIEDSGERETYRFQANRNPDQRHHIHYDNEIWLRTRVPKGLTSRRTSLLTNPPNGRFPPLTPTAAARVAAANEARRHPSAFDGYQTRPWSERCIAWGHEGPPILPPSYNDIHQIFQTPDHIVVFTELANNPPRIIPLDGRPRISDNIRQFPGDSRGRWEGDTLVVETRNFTERRRYRGSSRALHVVERFTRVAADRILYTFTVDDPTTWTSPWSAEVPMVRTEGPMFEYGCHEGNHDIRHILEIHRNLDK